MGNPACLDARQQTGPRVPVSDDIFQRARSLDDPEWQLPQRYDAFRE